MLRKSVVARQTRPCAVRVGSAARGVVALVLMAALAGCGSVGMRDEMISQPGRSLVDQGLTTPKSDPEHERIVASYGGLYDDPAAAQAVARAVGRLVAASDDPPPKPPPAGMRFSTPISAP